MDEAITKLLQDLAQETRSKSQQTDDRELILPVTAEEKAAKCSYCKHLKRHHKYANTSNNGRGNLCFKSCKCKGYTLK
jgi:hypothetical protein